MANDLNQCNFIGRLGKDPEVRYMPNGDAVASFTIAVGESWKDKQTGDVMESVEWVRCVAWRRLGEVCGEYLRKGQQVVISGKMKTRKWQDNQGQDRYTTEIQVDRMQMLAAAREKGPPPHGESRRPARDDADDDPGASTTPTRDSAMRGIADMDDDVPF